MHSTAPTGNPLPSGQLAFLFTDIEGSTARWERHPAAMEEAVARHDRVMRRIFIAHGGHVFKTMGDAFYVAFATPSAALDAAVAAQQALGGEDFTGVGGLHVRMAIHAGDVQARDNDYFGPPVNRVARLLSVAHGEQVILSGTAARMVRGLMPGLLDLGQHRLKDLAHPEAVFQVTGPGLRAEFPPLRSLSVLKHNLPLQTTSFVGRTEELNELKRHLADHRLVTLLGPGGLGKTRLSLQAGADLITKFPDGVWLVELAPLTDRELVAETVAALFGLAVPVGSDAVAAVTTFLAPRKLLLILDNCEHLIAEVVRLTGSIIHAAANVQIVTSSRERLGLGGEFVYRLPALSVPTADQLVTAAEALRHSAVRLFVERADLVLGGFELTDEMAADVVEICRRLDGIALAIELAVPRLKMLTPRELLARLKDRFRILTGGDRTALPRQQTLKALIDWSYVLLSATEQLVLRRLSVFADSATLEDAARVISDEHLEEFEIFDAMAALQEKSLIVRIGDDMADSRYRMLESTRAYGLERLKESGEEAALRRRLVALLLERFEQADKAYQTTATEPWLAAYGSELENLRAALEWCFSPAGDARAGARLVGLAVFLFDELSLPRERARWLDLARTTLDETTPPAIAGRILYGHASAVWLGQRQDAETLRRAVALFREAGDPLWLGCALTALGQTYARPGDIAEAAPHYRAAELLLRPLGRTRFLCTLLNFMGAAREFVGDPAAAEPLYLEAIAMARAIGTRRSLLHAMSNLAEFEFAIGHTEQALAFAREAEAKARRARARVPLAVLCTNLTGYLLAADDVAAARLTGAEGLQLNLPLGQDYFTVMCLEHLALAHALSGDLERAAGLAGHGEAYYAAEGRQRESTEQATWDRLARLLEAGLAPEDARRFKEAGAGWSRVEAAILATTWPGTPSPLAAAAGQDHAGGHEIEC